MSGRAFVVLMDEREEIVTRLKAALSETERLARSLAISDANVERARADLREIEDAMRKVDPAMASAVLTENTDAEELEQ